MRNNLNLTFYYFLAFKVAQISIFSLQITKRRSRSVNTSMFLTNLDETLMSPLSDDAPTQQRCLQDQWAAGETGAHPLSDICSSRCPPHAGRCL